MGLTLFQIYTKTILISKVPRVAICRVHQQNHFQGKDHMKFVKHLAQQ